MSITYRHEKCGATIFSVSNENIKSLYGLPSLEDILTSYNDKCPNCDGILGLALHLSKKFSLPINVAKELRYPYKYKNILSNESLTTSQMSKKIGLTFNTTAQYRSALIKTGLAKSKKFFSNEIRELCKKYKIDRKTAWNLKSAQRYLGILSNDELTYDEMAQMIGFKRGTITRYMSALLKAGLIERKRPTISNEAIKRITELRKDGCSITGTARKLGVSTWAIYRYEDKIIEESKSLLS